MRNINMQKHEWVARIEATLQTGQPFTVKYGGSDKATLLFACDIFRRRRHEVAIGFDPTPDSSMILQVSILPVKSRLEFTLKREQDASEIIQSISPEVNTLSLRGCGTVINTVSQVIEWALTHGWFIQKTFLNTLTLQHQAAAKQRNTTLVVVLRRGSNIDSI